MQGHQLRGRAVPSHGIGRGFETLITHHIVDSDTIHLSKQSKARSESLAFHQTPGGLRGISYLVRLPAETTDARLRP